MRRTWVELLWCTWNMKVDVMKIRQNIIRPWEGDRELLITYGARFVHTTVQTVNSCTSRPDVCQCLAIQTSMDNMSKNKPDTSMSQVSSESKLRSVVSSSMHPCPGNWVAIGSAVVYYPRAAQAFDSGIRYRHCRNTCLSCLHLDQTLRPTILNRLSTE